MTPNDFWGSTMDEVILRYRGKVDEWRFIRNNTNLIHCSLIEQKYRVDMLKALPLPFDDELESKEDGDEMMRIYKATMLLYNEQNKIPVVAVA